MRRDEDRWTIIEPRCPTSPAPTRPAGRARVLSTPALLSFLSVWKAAALAIAQLGVGRFFVVGLPRRCWAGSRRGPCSTAVIGLVRARHRHRELGAAHPRRTLSRAQLAFGTRPGAWRPRRSPSSIAPCSRRWPRGDRPIRRDSSWRRSIAGLVTGARGGPGTGDRDRHSAVIGLLWMRSRIGLTWPSRRRARGVWVAVVVLIALMVWARGEPHAGRDPVDARRCSHRSCRAGAAGRRGRSSSAGRPAADAAGHRRRRRAVPGRARVPATAASRRCGARGRSSPLHARLATPLRSCTCCSCRGGARRCGSTRRSPGSASSWPGRPGHAASPASCWPLRAVLLLLPAAHAALTDAEQTAPAARVERTGSPGGSDGSTRDSARYACATDITAAAAVLVILAGGGRVPWLARAYAVGIGATLLIRLTTLVRLRTRTPGPRVVPRAAQPAHRPPATLPPAWSSRLLLASAALLALVAIGDVPAIATCALVGGLVVVLAFGRRARGSRIRRPRHVRVDAADRSGAGAGRARPGNLLVAVRQPALALARRGGAPGGRRSRRRRDDGAPPRRGRRRTMARDRRRSRRRPSGGCSREVVALAERYGRPVRLLIVPAHNVVRRARRHDRCGCSRSEVYVGESVDAVGRRPGAAARRGLGAAPTSPRRSTSGSSSTIAAAAPTPITSARIRRRSRPAIST